MSAFFFCFFFALFFFFSFVLTKDKSKLIAQMGFFGKFTQKSPYFHEGEKKKKRS
jgi:hypothetical protein